MSGVCPGGRVEVASLIGELPVIAARVEERAVSGITLLVVHWDGSGTPWERDYWPPDRYAVESLAHIAKDWDGEGSYGAGLMYHERIDRWGRVWLTRRPEELVWAATRANRISYNLCVDAGPGWEPTIVQVGAVAARVACLRAQFGLGRACLVGHGELRSYGNVTECPGELLLRWLASYRRGEVLAVG